MNYELAKELKNAGFPQPKRWGVVLENCTCGTTEYLGKEKVHAPDSDCLLVAPTLSELIAECGDELVSINKEVGVAFGGKPCFTGRWHALGQPIKAKGDSPEEAVARLWLALNKKP